MLKVLAISPLGLFSRELRNQGIELISVAPPDKCFHPEDIAFDFYGNPNGLAEFVQNLYLEHKPDIIFQDDDSSPLLHAGLENLPIPKIWYAIDSHLHAWHRHFAACFDFVFFAQKNRSEEFLHFQKASAWLPLYMTTHEMTWVPWSERTRDTVFLGTLDAKLNPARIALLNEVQSRGIAIDILRGDYFEVYSHARIVLNQSVNDDLNFRFFEAPGCGALLITDDIGQSDLGILTPGEDFLLYKGAEELATKIRWALANPEVAEAMAHRAFAKIQNGHMGRHRAQTLLEKFQSLAKTTTASTDFQRSQLALSLQLCSFMNYPENVIDFFQLKGGQLSAHDASDPHAQAWIELGRGLALINRKDISSAWKYFQSARLYSEDQWLNQYWQHFKVATAQAHHALQNKGEA